MASTQSTKGTREQRCVTGLRADAWVGFLKAHSSVVKALDADLIARHGLPLSAYEVLLKLALSEEGHLRMSDLAQQALLSQSRISRLVDQLCNQGLIERRSCETDSRVVYAKITDAGRARLEDAEQTHSAGVQGRFFERLSEADLERLAEIWQQILAPEPATAQGSSRP